MVTLDLAAESARPALDAALEGVAAVVHAAGLMAGDDAAHARGTVAPTRVLLAAMAATRPPPRLALVSSFSVYGATSMPEGATLDEMTPLEPDPALRDPYARAKLAQESLARRAAQRDGLQVRALRPGVIVGPERVGTARLGLSLGPLLLAPGGEAPVPAVAVEDVGAALVAAVETPPGRSDAPILQGDGCFEAINVAAPEPPTQTQVLAALAAAGRGRRTVSLPRRPLRVALLGLSLVYALVPTLARFVPAALRLEAFDARFKPLRPGVTRLEDRLGLRPGDPLMALGRRP
jgi:nucleoside-diphosphate-sugar epimerase